MRFIEIRSKSKMEIERKYIIEETPSNLENYPHKSIRQAYISISPVIRIRQHGSDYILTIKGKGMIQREEYELTIDEAQFNNLSLKAEGLVIDKTRYYIPLDPYTIELDIFHKEHDGLVLAEVEFESMEAANAFVPPLWFGKDVSENPAYQNTNLSRKKQ